jgi:hypothetical protein
LRRAKVRGDTARRRRRRARHGGHRPLRRQRRGRVLPAGVTGAAGARQLVDVDVYSPQSPLGAALLGKRPGRARDLPRPTGARSASRSSTPSRSSASAVRSAHARATSPRSARARTPAASGRWPSGSGGPTAGRRPR